MTDHEPLDDLVFAAEEALPAARWGREAWKLLVVDDEEEVHSITRMVLGDTSSRGCLCTS